MDAGQGHRLLARARQLSSYNAAGLLKSFPNLLDLDQRLRAVRFPLVGFGFSFTNPVFNELAGFFDAPQKSSG